MKQTFIEWINQLSKPKGYKLSDYLKTEDVIKVSQDKKDCKHLVVSGHNEIYKTYDNQLRFTGMKYKCDVCGVEMIRTNSNELSEMFVAI